MALFSNIVAPLIAGLFFILYFIYFVIADPSKASSYWYFILFLVSMSLFSLGRPLQLVLGPYPLPLIIVNIRVFILCAVIAPVIILGSDLFSRRRRKGFEIAVVSAGALLGLTYIVFNTLGTHDSKELFHFAGIVARDNLTPERNPPFYGREVTISVQVVTGFLMFIFPFIKLFKLKPGASFKALLGNKHFLFNGGVSIFAIAFIAGSLTKKWEIYYIVSIASAILFGWSVLIDVKEVYRNYEKLIPFIKEDIMDNVAFSEFSQAKLKEMLGCLGKVCPNTIAMIKLKESGPGPLVELDKMDEAMRIANRRLARAFQEDSYLPIPLGVGQIGLAIRVPLEADSGSRPAMWDLLEEIQAELGKSLGCQAVIGIGRSYERIEDLRVSYHEALNAQEFAERHEERGIVHVDSIRELKVEAEAYPLKAKEKLLASIKVGDAEGSRQAFSDFMAQFSRFIAGKPEVLKVRLYELLGSMIDAAILGGGDEKKLNELVGESFNDIAHLKDAEIAEKWLSRLVVQIAGLVAHVHEKRSKSIVRNAILYMEENFRSPLSYRDVAKEVFVSPSYFLSLFKQETGQTFVDYITSIRMEKAKALLASTEKSVMEIADEVGFGNANYFSSSFKKATGMTPKEYRAKTSSRPAPDMLSD